MAVLVSCPVAATAAPKPKPKPKCEGRCAAIVEIAATHCRNAPKRVDRGFLKRLVEIELELGVPDRYRGMVLSAACRESGYRAKPRRGDGGRAVGLLQMWPWWEKRYKIKRTDPYASARAWITQILKSVRKARRVCGRKRAFVSAWAWVASGPQRWRCRSPRHYRLLRKWHRKSRWPSTRPSTAAE